MSSPRNRFFGFVLLFSSVLWAVVLIVFLFASDRRYRHLVRDYESKFDSLRVLVSTQVVASVSSPLSVSSSALDSSVRSAPSYRILGSGQNRKYCYLDVRHCNGERMRYYARFDDGIFGLRNMVQRLSEDEKDVLEGWYLDSRNAPLGDDFRENEFDEKKTLDTASVL